MRRGLRGHFDKTDAVDPARVSPCTPDGRRPGIEPTKPIESDVTQAGQAAQVAHDLEAPEEVFRDRSHAARIVLCSIIPLAVIAIGLMRFLGWLGY